MKVLVTSGNTQVMIDRVRCLTNIFSGRTGAGIALHACARGHTVTLLTSHPQVVQELQPGRQGTPAGLTLRPYQTFEDLHALLRDEASRAGLDAIIHAAAVSDYLSGGIFAPDSGTRFDTVQGRWKSGEGRAPALVDRAAGKVKSDEPELWLRLVRAPKLIDKVRSEWGFRGVLVKFKLEVGLEEEKMLAIAERSRATSQADLMVANTLEGMSAWAYLGPLEGAYVRLGRDQLPARLLEALEQKHGERSHG